MCRVVIDESKIETKEYKGIKPKVIAPSDEKYGAKEQKEKEINNMFGEDESEDINNKPKRAAKPVAMTQDD